MKISTKGRYGLRAMVDLAIHSSNGHVSLRSIAERQNISTNYLEQVVSALRKANLVKSIKGAQGGYTLLESPRNLKVSQILNALEGDLSLVDESQNTTPMHYCLSKCLWQPLHDRIYGLLDELTLMDLVDEYIQLNQENTYHI